MAEPARPPSNTVRGAVSGKVVQIGTVSGDVNLHTGAAVRTRYRLQVKRIAPPELVGREAELAELAEFCTSPATAGTYAWWRAEAWSGKSALMSTFVLNPPDGVRIVSFFVTARLSGQNDRAAFIDNVIEQLLTILGDDLPPFLTDATREAHLLGLLDDAAQACRARGEQFVLLVDGLDEDRGVSVDSDSYSIATLLPPEPPAGMRVVVAGRPNPPIPGDVDEHHPLRDPAIIRTLTPSPRARAIRESMERDLKKLLGGSAIEQDLLGLTAAAGGGLTAADLAELTGETRWQIDQYLRTVTGRSFTRRDSHYHPGASPDVYLLGHEEIQLTALEMLGPRRLAGYRDRLYAWARRHRADGWPGIIPEYLLRGYFGMLTATGDQARMVECATDAVRHDRMLALSGSDATALAEIAAVLDMLAAHEQPDLVAMIRVAMHRDRLTDRGGDVPVRLPALWAMVGRVNRAETVALSIKEPGRRVEALIAVAMTTFRNGDGERTQELLDHGEAAAATIMSPHERVRALTELVRCAAACGSADRARSLLDAATSNQVQEPEAQLALMRGAFVTGDLGRAALAAKTVTNPMARVKALTWLARMTDGPRSDLLDLAEQAVSSDVSRRDREVALAMVARAAVTVDDLDRAKRLSGLLCLASVRAEVDAALAGAAAAAGDLTEASRLAEGIQEPRTRARAWLTLAKEAGAGRAAGYLGRARTDARSVDRSSELLRAVVKTAVEAGELDLAESVSAEILSTVEFAMAQVSIVRVAVRNGDVERAMRLARAIADPPTAALAWLAVAKAAPEFLDKAEAAIEAVTAVPERVTRRVSLARVAADAGEAGHAARYLARSEADLRSVVRHEDHRHQLAALTGAAIQVGDHGRAHQLVLGQPTSSDLRSVLRSAVHEMITRHGSREAEAFVGLFDEVARSAGLETLVEALLERSDLSEAERVAESMASAFERPQALVKVAVSAADAGDIGRALALFRRHLHTWQDWSKLAPLVLALARADALDVMPLLGHETHDWAIEHVAFSRAKTEYRRAFGDPISEVLEDQWAGLMVGLDRIGRQHRWKLPEKLHRLAVRCRSAHLAGRVRSARRQLAHADELTPATESLLLEPLVQLAIEIGDFDRIEAMCGRLLPSETSKFVWMSAMRAVADSGDHDRVERMNRAITNDTDRMYAVMGATESDARRGLHERVAAAMSYLSEYPVGELARRRVVDALAGHGDYDHALAFARHIPDWSVRAEAFISIVDIALGEGDLATAATMAELVPDVQDQLRMATDVAVQAVRHDDLAVAARMADLVTRPAEQAQVWLKAAAAGSGVFRGQAIATALRLTRWHEVVEAVVEGEPSAFGVILHEFTTVQD